LIGLPSQFPLVYSLCNL